jgi:hypothetical protein
MNIVLLRETADKAITISTRGLAGVRRPKHANMTISQNTSILRKGLAIELYGSSMIDDRALTTSLNWSKQSAANFSCN